MSSYETSPATSSAEGASSGDTSVGLGQARQGAGLRASCGCGAASGAKPAGSCAACSGAAQQQAIGRTYPVYTVGRISPRLPNLGLEKEVAQAAGKAFKNGLSDGDALIALLKLPEHRRFALDVCWTFAVNGVDAYILRPQEALGLSMLTEAIGPEKSAADVDVVIGRVVGMSTPSECNGKLLPVLVPSQVYSYDREGLFEAMVKPKDLSADALRSAIKQTLEVTSQIGANAGIAASHRAVNYAMTRSSELYHAVASQLLESWALAGVTARPSSMSGEREVMDVILTFRSRLNDAVRKLFMKVDVTDLYPFLVAPIQPFVEMS